MTYKAVWSQSGFPVSLVLIKAAVPASLVAQSFSVPLEGGVFIPGDSTLNLLLQSWGAFIGVEFLVEKHFKVSQQFLIMWSGLTHRPQLSPSPSPPPSNIPGEAKKTCVCKFSITDSRLFGRVRKQVLLLLWCSYKIVVVTVVVFTKGIEWEGQRDSYFRSGAFSAPRRVAGN